MVRTLLLSSILILSACSNPVGVEDYLGDVTISPAQEVSMTMGIGWYQPVVVMMCAPAGVDPNPKVEFSSPIVHLDNQADEVHHKTGGLCSDGRIAWRYQIHLIGESVGTTTMKVLITANPREFIEINVIVEPDEYWYGQKG